MATASTIGGDLRRRRAASYRCEPMRDGRRDPLAPKRPTATVIVRAIGKETVEYTGCDVGVYDVLRRLGVRYQRARAGGAWLIRQRDAEDVTALLEYRGHRVEVTL